MKKKQKGTSSSKKEKARRVATKAKKLLKAWNAYWKVGY